MYISIWKTSIFIVLGKFLSGTLVYTSVYKKLQNCFPKWLFQFALYEGSSCSAPSPRLGIHYQLILIWVVLINIEWNLTVVFTCISLMSNILRIFQYVYLTSVELLVWRLFWYFAYFKMGLFIFLLLIFKYPLCVLEYILC